MEPCPAARRELPVLEADEVALTIIQKFAIDVVRSAQELNDGGRVGRAHHRQ